MVGSHVVTQTWTSRSKLIFLIDIFSLVGCFRYPFCCHVDHCACLLRTPHYLVYRRSLSVSVGQPGTLEPAALTLTILLYTTPRDRTLECNSDPRVLTSGIPGRGTSHTQTDSDSNLLLIITNIQPDLMLCYEMKSESFVGICLYVCLSTLSVYRHS